MERRIEGRWIIPAALLISGSGLNAVYFNGNLPMKEMCMKELHTKT